jgi:hypothetical protein
VKGEVYDAIEGCMVMDSGMASQSRDDGRGDGETGRRTVRKSG